MKSEILPEGLTRHVFDPLRSVLGGYLDAEWDTLGKHDRWSPQIAWDQDPGINCQIEM